MFYLFHMSVEAKNSDISQSEQTKPKLHGQIPSDIEENICFLTIWMK